MADYIILSYDKDSGKLRKSGNENEERLTLSVVQAAAAAARIAQAYNSSHLASLQRLQSQMLLSLQQIAAINNALGGMKQVASNISTMIRPSLSILAAQQASQISARLARYKPLEPFLSSALIASGLNSPTIHMPTFQFPSPRVISTKADLEEERDAALKRRRHDDYDKLHKLETSLRQFIESELRDVHGDIWWETGISEPIRRQCEKRKRKEDRDLCESWPPIHYTYIGDLRWIILTEENWRYIFQRHFPDKQETEVIFKRLNQLRRRIAHFRDLSDNMHLMFTVECNIINQIILKSAKLSKNPSS